MEGPWDPGLQVERTTLAWLRTALAFVIGLLVLIRLILHHSVVAGVVCAVLTLPLGVAIAWFTWQRHHRTEHSLRSERPLPDAVLPGAVSLPAILGGCTGIVYVLTV